jgi:hypothetical protein
MQTVNNVTRVDNRKPNKYWPPALCSAVLIAGGVTLCCAGHLVPGCIVLFFGAFCAVAIVVTT